MTLKYTFLGQNRLKIGFSNLNVLQKGSWKDWVSKLGLFLNFYNLWSFLPEKKDNNIIYG
jgi:hypothetical protein